MRPWRWLEDRSKDWRLVQLERKGEMVPARERDVASDVLQVGGEAIARGGEGGLGPVVEVAGGVFHGAS